MELVRGCDALVYDRLVGTELVAEAPADALAISRDGIRQEQINALLVELAGQGLDVVRLDYAVAERWLSAFARLPQAGSGRLAVGETPVGRLSRTA